MIYSIRSTGALAVLWLAALAAVPASGQNKAADPADASAAVPPTRYVPMLAARVAAPATNPAQNWKAANQTVADIDSMSLTMDMDAPAAQAAPGQVPAAAAAAAAPAPALAPAPAAPAPAAAPAPPPDAHAHHHMNKAVK